MTISDNPEQGTGHTFDETVEAFSRLLDPEAGATDARDENSLQDDEAETDEVEALEAEDSEDDALEDESDEDEDSEAEEDEADHDDEEGDEPALDLNQKVSVKIDGQTMEVPLSEVINGYQRQSDYSKKTAALAEERKAFQAEMQAVRQERQQYAYMIQALEQELQAKTAQEPDWQYLYENDPLEYLRQKDAYRDMQARMQAAQAERIRIEQMRAQEEAQAFQQYVASEREKMLEKVPQWRDPKVWARDRAAIIEYGLSMGFTQEELSQASDHRAVVALYHSMKAAKVANAKANAKPASAKPVASAPKPMTTQGKAPKRADGLTKAKQRLSKTGSLDAAAEVFKHLL